MHWRNVLLKWRKLLPKDQCATAKYNDTVSIHIIKHEQVRKMSASSEIAGGKEENDLFDGMPRSRRCIWTSLNAM